MAILINGNGNQAIYAAQDADWYASIFGGQTAITGVGYQFEASLLDANTIGVKDGVIITQEGRRIQIDANVIDTFDIPTGGQGETNYYIIGYHLVTGTQSEQTCETFVRLMENATDTIPEGTFRGGDDDVYISLYRVTQDDLVITDIDLLLPTVQTITDLNNSISECLPRLIATVTADGVKNNATLVSELFSKIGNLSFNEILKSAIYVNDANLYRFTYKDNTQYKYSLVSHPASATTTMGVIEVYSNSSSCHIYSTNISGTSITNSDAASSVPTSGSTFKLYVL